MKTTYNFVSVTPEAASTLEPGMMLSYVYTVNKPGEVQIRVGTNKFMLSLGSGDNILPVPQRTDRIVSVNQHSGKPVTYSITLER